MQGSHAHPLIFPPTCLCPCPQPAPPPPPHHLPLNQSCVAACTGRRTGCPHPQRHHCRSAACLPLCGHSRCAAPHREALQLPLQDDSHGALQRGGAGPAAALPAHVHTECHQRQVLQVNLISPVPPSLWQTVSHMLLNLILLYPEESNSFIHATWAKRFSCSECIRGHLYKAMDLH